MRKETKVKRARERGANSNLSSSYLEPEREDGSDDDNAISLSAIKNKFNKKSMSKSEFSQITQFMLLNCLLSLLKLDSIFTDNFIEQINVYFYLLLITIFFFHSR